MRDVFQSPSSHQPNRLGSAAASLLYSGTSFRACGMLQLTSTDLTDENKGIKMEKYPEKRHPEGERAALLQAYVVS